MNRPVADLLIEAAETLVTPTGPAPGPHGAPGAVTRLSSPTIAGAGGRILWVGPAAQLADHVQTDPRTTRIDATGCSLIPGFVDGASPTDLESDVADAGGDWALAHGTTTWLAAKRRADVHLLAPIEILLRTRADLSVAQEELAHRPAALTAVTRVGSDLQVASMPYALSLACLALGLSFEAALTAATLNAAWAIDRENDRGSLEAGKRLDVVVVGGAPERLVAAGAPAVRMVIRNGSVTNWVQEPGGRRAEEF